MANLQDANSPSGEVDEYDVNNGRFLGSLAPANFPGQFNPRGVVFGPDGYLYVSSFDTTNSLVGYVLRFNPDTGASTIVAANNGDGIAQPGEIQDLHRPEGLVFGPDGNLYVTSFRANAADTDKILVLNSSDGRLCRTKSSRPGGPTAGLWPGGWSSARTANYSYPSAAPAPTPARSVVTT